MMNLLDDDGFHTLGAASIRAAVVLAAQVKIDFRWVKTCTRRPDENLKCRGLHKHLQTCR
jgi:hypothetical protein